MSDLPKNAIEFLQKRFPFASVLSNETTFFDQTGAPVFSFYPMIADDMQSGVRQRAIAIESLGSRGEIQAIAQSMIGILDEMGRGIYVKMSNPLKPRGHEIDTNQMTYAPRVILYTNKLCVPIQQVLEVFGDANTLIDVVDESEMHKTLFISYGGPDEGVVSSVVNIIKARGVKTWFFPDDALPGEKLHRMMHDGVNKHDRVLLVCSKNSLVRPGVLNEIERVFEREAKEGGTEILIPISIDDFVYGDWAPERKDIADQVRARVITKIATDNRELLEEQVGKVVSSLRK